MQAKYKDTLVCNYISGKDASRVKIPWIAKTKLDPDGCEFLADAPTFEGFRCLPSKAIRFANAISVAFIAFAYGILA